MKLTKIYLLNGFNNDEIEAKIKKYMKYITKYLSVGINEEQP